MKKTELLDRISETKEDRVLFSRILDQAERARQKNIPTYTPFLNPRERRLGEQLLSLGEFTNFFVWGGYEKAERVSIFFFPSYQWNKTDDIPKDFPISILQTSFRSDAALTHRDFLGAILGMGIKREKIGDILIDETQCTIFLLKELEPFFIREIEQIKRTNIKWQKVEIDQLKLPAQRFEQICNTVKSLRLDAVLACGFSLSRGKAVDLIVAGRVSHNAFVCIKPDQTIQENDIISARGFGKFKVTKANQQSRKGRTILQLERYL